MKINNDAYNKSQTIKSPSTLPAPEYKMEIIWTNIMIFSIIHLGAAYGFTVEKSWASFIFGIFFGYLGGIGTTAGAHRLFAHKTYKANLPLKILLIFLQSIAFQHSVYDWSRDHRVHHKYCDTNADPHNSRRGFFFSHMGWLMCKKHPDVKTFGKKVDMSDLEADKIVMFQDRFYLPIALLCSVILPTIILHYYFNESLIASVTYGVLTRQVTLLHLTWLINSAAHSSLFGYKPYDKTISTVENKAIGIVTLGEGFHNYHHAFPQDYKTSELGNYSVNSTTAFLDFFSWLGWAYDLKSVSKEIVKKRALRTGDGSYGH